MQHLLREMVPLERIPGLIAQGHLQALAVSASSYSTGQHVTFFDGKPGLQPWVRSQRHAVAGPICQEHLLASSDAAKADEAAARELIGKLRKAYRHLIHHNTSRAIALIEGDPTLSAPEVQYLVDFIRTAAKRGVILRRPSKKADGDEE